MPEEKRYGIYINMDPKTFNTFKEFCKSRGIPLRDRVAQLIKLDVKISGKKRIN